MKYTTRLKKCKQMIRMARPFDLSPSDLIYPIFVREDGKTSGIPSIEGERYFSLKDCTKAGKEAIKLGIPALMVFSILKRRNPDGSVALRKDNFDIKVFKRLKNEFKDDLVIISNVCLCTYTSSETCVYSEQGKVLNEKTAEMLGKISVAHAKAGADVVAPSAMVDGQVRHIRKALDEFEFDDIPIMSYIKSDTLLFKPFFRAISSSRKPRVGVDSSKFRTDPINEKMFLQKISLDINEGADMVIIKPAITNLDVIRMTAEMFPEIPIAAYQVSGEYAMIKSLSQQYGLSENGLLFEMLYSIKRAGASTILSYHAVQAANFLKSAM
jgi:porphobilinogen synthase